MRICFVASEMTPLAQTGGLGDVVGSLAATLAARGHTVSVVLPLVPSVRARLGGRLPEVGPISARFQGRDIAGTLRQAPWQGGVTLWFVDRPAYYDRPALYHDGGVEFPDNPYRFAFLALGALQAPALLGTAVDLYHCHDWQAALLPFYARTQGAPEAATLLTVHNLTYQGNYAPDVVDGAGLDPAAFQWRGIEFYGQVSFLKAGLLTADRLNTVSPRYAREIQTPEYGAGLDGVLRARATDLEGILNGADYDRWSPAADPSIAAPYSAEDVSGKQACRAALAARCGWTPPPSGPIFGVVSRLVEQKGADLLPKIAPAIASVGGALVVLGEGDPAIQEALRRTAERLPDLVHVTLEFDETFAHQILAGADAVLMPSRFEPCGLTQLYALRYGAVPIVRATGGLADTIEPYVARAQTGTGFTVSPNGVPGLDEAESLAAALRGVAAVYSDPTAWDGLMRRGMAQRHTWEASAEAYEACYVRTRAAAARRGPLPWDPTRSEPGRAHA